MVTTTQVPYSIKQPVETYWHLDSAQPSNLTNAIAANLRCLFLSPVPIDPIIS